MNCGSTECGSLYTVMGDSRIVGVVRDIEEAVGDRGWVKVEIRRDADWTTATVQCTFKFARPNTIVASSL